MMNDFLYMYEIVPAQILLITTLTDIGTSVSYKFSFRVRQGL